jgi:zinc protease
MADKNSSAVHEHTFDNGFKLVYRRTNQAPAIALDLWIGVGSSEETEREAGIAHVLEHMLFKGTKKRGPGDIAREVESLGGEINAFTSFDYTVFTLALAGRYADRGVDILHDAITSSAFDPEELEREKLVILEEIKRGRDMPHNHLSQLLFRAAYPTHPYGKPVIGHEDSVRSFTRADLRRFVRRWYRPSNMTLVAVGPNPFSEVKKLAEASFGQIARTPAPRKHRRPVEKELPQFTAAVEEREVSEVYFDLAFAGPNAKDEDVAAVDLLSTILGHGESSRLNTRVKLDLNLVQSVGAGAYTPADPGLIYIGGVASGEKFADAYRAICEELSRLINEPVGTEELEQAKAMVEADFIFERETVQGQAQKIGYCHTVLGDADNEREYLEKLAAVDSQKLQKIAQRYLGAQKALLCFLYPKETPTPLETAEARRIMESAQVLKAGKTVKNQKPRKQMEKITLSNGIRVLVRRNTAVPVAAIRTASLGGSRLDPTGSEGGFHLLGECLSKGTVERDVFAIAHTADRIGGHVGGYSGRNSYGVKAELLSKHLEEGVDLVCDLLLNSAMVEGEVDKSRNDTLSMLRRRKDSPASLAFRAFEKALYKDHPYGNDPLGTAEALKRIDGDTLRNLHRAALHPENLTVAVAGDVDPDNFARLLEERLCVQYAPTHLSVPAAAKAPTEDSLDRIALNIEQAHVVVGCMTTTMYESDRIALSIVNSILSGMGGRLFRTLRDEQGLAYTVTSTTMEGIDRGYLAGYIATSPDNAEAARQGLLAEIARLAEGGSTDEEVEKAKNKLAGSYDMGFQENSLQAAHMALDEIYDMDYRRFATHAREILAVSRKRVERVAKKYLTGTNWVSVIAGPK